MPRPSYVPRQPSHDTHDMHNGRFPQPPCVSSHAQLPIFLTHEAPADNALACKRLVTPLYCTTYSFAPPAVPRRMVCSPSSSPTTLSVPRQPGCRPAYMPSAFPACASRHPHLRQLQSPSLTLHAYMQVGSPLMHGTSSITPLQLTGPIAELACWNAHT